MEPLFRNAAVAEDFDRAYRRGPYRLLPRTDGTFALIDARRPWNDRIVKVLPDLIQAGRALREAWCALRDRAVIRREPIPNDDGPETTVRKEERP